MLIVRTFQFRSIFQLLKFGSSVLILLLHFLFEYLYFLLHFSRDFRLSVELPRATWFAIEQLFGNFNRQCFINATMSAFKSWFVQIFHISTQLSIFHSPFLSYVLWFPLSTFILNLRMWKGSDHCLFEYHYFDFSGESFELNAFWYPNRHLLTAAFILLVYMFTSLSDVTTDPKYLNSLQQYNWMSSTCMMLLVLSIKSRCM